VYEIDNILCVIYYSRETLGTVGVISGKSAKIIKKGLLFILRDWKREGRFHMVNSKRVNIYTYNIIYDMKKKRENNRLIQITVIVVDEVGNARTDSLSIPETT
jgi:hypothetical protein